MPSTRQKALMLMGVFLLALIARAGCGTVSVRESAHAKPGQVSSLHFDDEQWYWSIAQSYRAGSGMVGEYGHRAERMPLYPWVLSWFPAGEGGVSGARWLQYIVGALAACAVTVLAWRLSTYGLVAGCIVALDPTMVGSASLLLNETLAVTLIAFVWLAALPLSDPKSAATWRWGLMTALIVLAVYTKESTLPIAVAMLAYLIVVRSRLTFVPHAIVTIFCIVFALLPWAYRNKQVTGEWIFLTSRGGISLFDGVHPGASGASHLATIKTDPKVLALDEPAWNAHFKDAAWTYIKNDPVRIFRLALTKLARTWSPVLNAAEYDSNMIRVIFAGWYIPLYGLIAWGIYRSRHDRALLLGLLIPTLCVCAMHALFVGSVRYRLVAMPTLAILAAMGLQAIIDRRRFADAESPHN